MLVRTSLVEREAILRRAFYIGVALLTLACTPALAGTRDAQWAQVREAIRKGLPKSAIAALDPIIAGAVRDKAYPEAIKAIGMRNAQQGNIEGGKAEERIVRLQAEIGTYPNEMRPVLEAILAHQYWQYFQQNRWRFQQRTPGTETLDSDMQTWDLSRILAAVDAHFTKALADAKTLKSTPVAAYDSLLVKGNVPDAYRPTLFDFLAHEALLFYVAGEQGVAAPEDAFELAADGPIFAPAQQFLKWRPDTTDENSPALKAVRLYQTLLAFHQNDDDRSAWLDVDLERLVFGHNKAAGEDKNDRYKAALKRFADESASHVIAARALAQWARMLHEEGNELEAHRVAQRGFDAFPKSAGGTLCFNLLQEIETPSVHIQTERVWNEPRANIEVTYRNVTQVFFRAVPYDFQSYLKSQRWLYNYDDAFRRELLRRTPVREWNARLPAALDYRSRTEQLPAPAGLKPGYYFIVASHDPSFGAKENRVSVAAVWVSDLALVVRQRGVDGTVEGFVLDATSGEPLPGATVQAWGRDSKGWSQPGERVSTNRNGLFRLTRNMSSGQLLVATHGTQQLANSNDVAGSRHEIEAAGDRTVFFTDRSLYRPGQTIYYKGIRVYFDPSKNDYRTLGRDPVTVTFSDPNGKEIAHATHRCNDYGSFDGTFTAPRGGLLGSMQIQGPNGAASFNVEEYKRPKFQVELAAPKEAAKLTAKVVVTGKATAYTGAAIGGAKVQWRVARQVRYPAWCWWGGWGGRGQQAQAIAHGSAVTSDDGTFKVEFVAAPDRSIPEKNEPTFVYEIHADVTDTNGETRSDEQSVRAGYTALQASLTAADWQTPAKPVELTVGTTSLDGEPQAVQGTLKIYRLVQPAKVARAAVSGRARDRYSELFGETAEPQPDPADPNSWAAGDVVGDKVFQTDDKGVAKVAVRLPAGAYRAMLETSDRFGKRVQARLLIQVVNPKVKHLRTKVANVFTAMEWTVEPGERFAALWGTGYDKGRAFVEIEHRGKQLRGYWTPADQTQELVDQIVNEDMRGGFTIRVTFVHDNRAYVNERIVDVPWSNKELTVRWEHFRSKLDPGKKETWTATVTTPNDKKAAAEMVATLYDASLDQFVGHEWMDGFGVFRHEIQNAGTTFANSRLEFQFILGDWSRAYREAELRYRSFGSDVVEGAFPNQVRLEKGPSAASAWRIQGADLNLPPSLPQPATPMPVTMPGVLSEAFEVALPKVSQARGPDLSKVQARKNLDETAFFFPHLLADKNGTVKLEFTMPEALTEWKFLGFAHDSDLRSGLLTDRAVTAKDLMVEPNPPRFVREGDQIEFTVKVSNQTAARQTGRVQLMFANARSLESMDRALGNTKTEVDFDVPGKQSRTYAWRLTVPDGCEFLTYKAVGGTATLSDGEEGFLPVLSRRILVIESLPLPIRGAQTKQFEFTKLLDAGKSASLRHQSLTVQMVSQPAWYAVMALPYLMEYPYECSEQTFNRLYANVLARHIAASDPKIRRVFDLWKGTPALDSPLQKNQDLKAVMLEETPWLQQAQAEGEARRNVGLLFDSNRLNDETERALQKLSDMQSSDGLWPWFPGGSSDYYITLYITTGFGRLRHLGAKVDLAPAVKSLPALDGWMNTRYRDILAHGHEADNHLDYTMALYLYGRGFFLADQPVADTYRAALDYWRGQARKYWLDLGCRQSQAHIALGLLRFGDKETPRAIMQSIKEHSLTSPELGMYWRDLERSWWWYRAPIETQAMMIEAFAEVTQDAAAVEDCKVWLLKQKQTQDWKTTKATADAIYGLLLQGTNLLSSDALVEVALAGKTLQPERIEAGTGFYEQRFTRGEIQPAMGRITVKKTDAGVSWGSVHWQYLEDMAKVTPYEGTPLKLKKTLFTKVTTKKGQVLQPVTGTLGVGDELVVRIELRTDRDMEYVHLTDQRGSGTEPVSVQSRYKFQDGLGYYESTRDTASHFFISYLPKGVYVFEYSTRIQSRGAYQTGIASIQSMYAPEFNSHSESFVLEVK